MRALNAAEILGVWEQGAARRPIERALSLLAAALPGHGRDDLARLPLGIRDRRLIELCAASFGDPIALYARCPTCDESAELSLSASGLLTEEPAEPDQPRGLALGACEIQFRLPDSHDLLAIESLETEQAEECLLGRCVLTARVAGREVGVGALSPPVREALADAMAAADPQAEIDLALRCPACALRWSAPFDIVTVLWARVEREAGQLLQQVDALARVYGWRESDVLSLTPARRAIYLEMVL